MLSVELKMTSTFSAPSCINLLRLTLFHDLLGARGHGHDRCGCGDR